MGAVEVAQHKRRVPDELKGQQAAGRPIAAERCHGARVEVDDAGLAGLGWAFDQLLAGALVLHNPDTATHRKPRGV
jgi:hypothetical protein